MGDWVASGSCLPEAPTDPYGHALVHTVPQNMASLRATLDDTRIGKRMTTQQFVEAKPEKFALAVAAVEPLVPATVNFKLESRQRLVVSTDPIVRIMSVEFLTQLHLLLADWSVSVVTTPMSNAPHGSTKTTGHRP